MPLILFIDFVLVVVLVTVYKRRGLEAVLPYFAFIVTLVPDECRITLPGLFDLRAQRVAVIMLAILFFKSRRRSQTLYSTQTPDGRQLGMGPCFNFCIDRVPDKHEASPYAAY